MSLLKIYDPFFENFFDWDITSTRSAEGVKTSFNKETGENLIWVSAPGFSREEIHIETDENKLLISGELKDEESIKKVGKQNFSYYVYQKGLTPESISASLKNGILEVSFKTPEVKKLQKQKVEIKLLE